MVSEREVSAVGAVAALGDPQRSRLYDVVRKARRPVTREEAATAVDISRKLAAFHLDKLVASGLLEVVLEPLPGPRSVGRTPKRYRPAERVVSVCVPPRSYETLASVLVDAMAGAGAGESLRSAAREHGRRRGEQFRGSSPHAGIGHDGPLSLVESALADEGFDPYRAGPFCVRTANCPFDPLSARAPGVVCELNVHYVTGLLAGIGQESLSVRLAPRYPECCVEIVPGE